MSKRSDPDPAKWCRSNLIRTLTFQLFVVSFFILHKDFTYPWNAYRNSFRYSLAGGHSIKAQLLPYSLANIKNNLMCQGSQKCVTLACKHPDVFKLSIKLVWILDTNFLVFDPSLGHKNAGDDLFIHTTQTEHHCAICMKKWWLILVKCFMLRSTTAFILN